MQANLVIAEAAPHEQADLLRCPLPSLERVIILRTKEDYWQLAGSNGIEPFTKGEPAIRHIDNIAADVPSEATKVTGDFFSRSLPQSETPRFDAAAKSDPAESAGGSDILEGGVAAASIAPDFSPVADIDASLGDAVPSEIASTPEQRDAPAAEESAPVDALSLARVGEPVGTESAQTQGSAEVGQTVEAAHASALETMEPTRRIDIQLEVSLPKDDEDGTPFGLWLPPKIGSKDFKKWLGDSADDGSVREFYARHRRLHTHLTDLQRKLLSAKSPLSHDQVLALRLVSEEAVLHLSKLASSSLTIEEQAKTERLRIQNEDWIEQGGAADHLLESGRDDVSESRSSLVADSSALLNRSLKSFVIGGGDSDRGETLSGAATKRLTLRGLVERLNSVLLFTF